jgi:hypothetical protein
VARAQWPKAPKGGRCSPLTAGGQLCYDPSPAPQRCWKPEMPERLDTERRAVMRAWGEWAKLHPVDATKSTAGMLFFAYLRNERPDLLDFKAGTQDKWQLVHGWLRRDGRVAF